MGRRVIGRLVGVAGEVGWLFGARPNVPGGPDRSTMVAGFHVIVPLIHASQPRVQPFLLGGLAFLKDAISDSSVAYVFGGGANVWAAKRVGLRAEFSVPVGFSSDTGWTVGLGFTVR